MSVIALSQPPHHADELSEDQTRRIENIRHESAEDVHRRARTSLALLVRWMEAEQYTDRGGTSVELEHDAWYAAEDLLRQALEDVNRLNLDVESLQDALRGASRRATGGAK